MTLKGLLMLCAVLSLAAGACSSGAGHRPDGSVDATTYDLSLDLPAGCPPSQPNDKGVGALCTRGGHECTGSLVCACDTVDGLTLNGVPCICTMVGLNPKPNNPSPCNAAAPSCGASATCCDYMNIAYYCSPNVCLPGGACINFTPAGGG
jgi:hypothetical protein